MCSYHQAQRIRFHLLPVRLLDWCHLLYSFFPASNSSAALFFVPLCSLSLRVGFAPSPDPPEILALAAFFNLSVSSLRRSSFFPSSSSSSPRAKGSLSSSGAGATDVRGCHFLALPLLGVDDGLARSKASTSSTGPDCGGLGWGLKRSGLVGRREEVRGGWAGAGGC